MKLVGISVIKISFSSQRYLPINISMVFIFVLNRGQFSFPSNTTSLLHQGCAWLPGFWCKVAQGERARVLLFNYTSLNHSFLFFWKSLFFLPPFGKTPDFGDKGGSGEDK